MSLTAADVKRALRARHPGGYFGGMVGEWTCIEEFRGIDLLAWSAWHSHRNARVGYEVKVSRSDLRRELLKPSKRAANVEWCNEFYFAVPSGLLTDEELAFVEPEWEPEDFVGERCPSGCRARYRVKTHRLRVPVPRVYENKWDEYYAWDEVVCPTCKGKGVIQASRVEREAPTCWVPRDVGLVVVNGNGTRVVRKSTRRKEVPTLGVSELADLVRWVSARPDPRHHEQTAVVAA